MKSWKRVEPTTVARVAYRTIVEKSFINPDGAVVTYGTISPEDSHNVAVIALTANNNVIVARQFRAGPERVFDELPGGGLEAGEDKQEAALRELLEETGYAPKGSVLYLGDVCRDAYSNSHNHYFLALDCIKVAEVANDHGEFTEPIEITIDALLFNAKNFKMSDTAGVVLAYDRLLEIQHETTN